MHIRIFNACTDYSVAIINAALVSVICQFSTFHVNSRVYYFAQSYIRIQIYVLKLDSRRDSDVRGWRQWLCHWWLVHFLNTKIESIVIGIFRRLLYPSCGNRGRIRTRGGKKSLKRDLHRRMNIPEACRRVFVASLEKLGENSLRLRACKHNYEIIRKLRAPFAWSNAHRN